MTLDSEVTPLLPLSMSAMVLEPCVSVRGYPSTALLGPVIVQTDGRRELEGSRLSLLILLGYWGSVLEGLGSTNQQRPPLVDQSDT